MRPVSLYRLGALAALVVLAAAAPAVAAEGGEKKGGIGFAGLRYDLALYTLLVFGLLIIILKKYAWPHIQIGLEKRESNIRTALDQAKQDQNAAAALVTQAKKQMDEAAARIKEMLDEARRDADTLRAAEREAGAKDAQAERERAKREIEAAKDVALAEIYERSVDLATLLSARTLARQITADDHRRLLKESLDELKQAARSA